MNPPGIPPSHIQIRKRLESEYELTKTLPLGSQRIEDTERLIKASASNSFLDLELELRIEQIWNALEAGLTSLALSHFVPAFELYWKAAQDNKVQIENSLFSQFLLIPQLLTRHPKVDAKTIIRLNEWMEYFTSNTTISEIKKLNANYQTNLGLGLRCATKSVIETIDLWNQSHEHLENQFKQDQPPCPIHQVRSQIGWQVANHNYEQALSLFNKAKKLSEKIGRPCKQSSDIDTLLMTPYAWSSKSEKAWLSHINAYETQVESSQYLGDLAMHLRFCAAIWDIEEGLEILNAHGNWFASPEDPWDLLTATRCAALLLGKALEIAKEEQYRDIGVQLKISGQNSWMPFIDITENTGWKEAKNILERVALKLSAQYDLRNINNQISEKTKLILRSSSVCSSTEIRQLTRSRNHRYLVLKEINAPFDGCKIVNNDNAISNSQAEKAWHHWNRGIELFYECVLPPAINWQVENLRFSQARLAILASCRQWRACIEQGETVTEQFCELGDYRHALTSSLYLVQAHLALGNISQARQAYCQADTLWRNSSSKTNLKVFEDLALLAG